MHVGEAQRRIFLPSRLHLLFFVLQAVIITGVGLEVTLSPPQLTVFEGENAKFTCSPLIPVAVPLLEQDGFVVTKENHPRISFTDNGRGSLEGNRTYTLTDVALSDNGTWFRCSVAGFISNNVTMSVFVRPRITGRSGLVTIIENTTIPTTLTYTTVGVPQPHSYRWLRDGAHFFGNGRIKVVAGALSSLEVRSPSREDSASYTLVAISTVGQGTLTVELQVVYNEFIEAPQDQEVPEGTTVTMRCVHKFGWSYTWRSNRRWISTDDSKVSIGPSSSTLHYGPVDYTDDLMDFYCLTRLANGQYFTSPSAILQVLSAPVITVPHNYTVVEGSDVRISFDVSGHPAPHTLQYFFNGVQLSPGQSSSGHVTVESEGTLLIKGADRFDEGVYSLLARNDFGEATRETHLFVLFIPIIVHRRSSVIVQVGRPTMIPCGQQVLSNPPASFTWSKFPNQNIRPELQHSIDPTNGSLLLSSAITYSDSGTYTCTARNSVGHASTLVKVVVLEPPDPPHDIRVKETGSSWARVEWLPPDNIGPLPPLTVYRVVATPRRTSLSNSLVDELIVRISNLESRNEIQNDSLSVLDGRFDPNSTCVEVTCETITVDVEARFTEVNISGLVPAHVYDLTVQSLSNGTNLISRPSDAITVITQQHVPNVGSVTSAVYGPGAALVYWTLAYSGGQPVQLFEIAFKKVNASRWQNDLDTVGSGSSNSIPPEFRSWIVNGLEAEEHYLFRVRAMNELGYGNYTEMIIPILSHMHGVPSPPTRPRVAGWAEDFAVIELSLTKIGVTDTENVTLSVMLMLDGIELERQMFEVIDNYTLGSVLQLEYVNLTYRGDWQFAVSCTNSLGESLPSPLSLHAQDNIQEPRTAYEIGGPVIGCLMGTVNMAVLTMVIILFVVMGQETRKQQQSMARRVEMSQAVNDLPTTDCPFSPQSLIYRSSPDGRSNTARATPSDTVYAEICQQSCPVAFILPTSNSSVSAV